METRLWIIFKPASATMLIKKVLESPYIFLQSSEKRAIFKRAVQFSKSVQLRATFNV